MASSKDQRRQRRLFQRVDAGVSLPRESLAQRTNQRCIQQQLADGETDRHAADREWVAGPKDPQSGEMDVAADRKGEQIHLVPQLAHRLEHLAERDRGAAVLVERLWSDREDPARGDLSGAGEPPCTGRSPLAGRITLGRVIAP